jgi:homoserine O-acetyltransferase
MGKYICTGNWETMNIFKLEGQLELESGSVLSGVEVAYTMYGTLNPQKDNVIWVCHALTANALPEEWWPGLVGVGKLMDPNKYCIICVNILGSCYGSTFAGSIDPNTRNQYGDRFPLVTVRDHVQVLKKMRTYLEIDRITLLIGASLGGQHVLEWAIEEPFVFDRIGLLATNAKHSPWGIAFNEAQRMAIHADPTLYEDRPDRGWKGLAAARAIAMLSYRNYRTYQLTQLDSDERIDMFKAASYQQYQGEKLCKRFHPWAYLTLSKMMDSHDVGRGRGGIEQALGQIRAKTMVVGIESDFLFPLLEQQFLAREIPGAFLKVLNSKYGHDGFLIEYEILTEILGEFLSEE